MVKFIKLDIAGINEYYNANNIVAIDKKMTGTTTQTFIYYDSSRSSQYTFNTFVQNLDVSNYIIEAIMNANSSSHTNNVYYPEITQGKQPSIDSAS
jgi:hypothetical protein